MNLPNKVKVFFWRGIRNALPVKTSLRRRGIDIDSLCPLCDCCDETLLHVLKSCTYSRLFWAISPLADSLLNIDADSLLSWVDLIRNKATVHELDQFVMLCWSIWKSINSLVHENKKTDAIGEIQKALDFATKYQAARKPASNSLSSDSAAAHEWRPPDSGYVKINFDASFSSNRVGAGVGVVVWDCNGAVVAWRRLAFINSPEVAECMAARIAVQFAQDFGCTRVIFEGDSQNVIHQIQDSTPFFPHIGAVVDEVQT